MSIRLDRDNYEFLHHITWKQGSDLSKAVREMVSGGGILLAVQRYFQPFSESGPSSARTVLGLADTFNDESMIDRPVLAVLGDVLASLAVIQSSRGEDCGN